MSSVIFGLGTPEIITLGRKDDGCEIKTECPLNNYNRKVLDEILQKHNLRMREDKGYIIVYQ
jgi:hypothetical protein